MSGRSWTLGVAASHNGAAVLRSHDGRYFGVQEERLTRAKRARVWAGVPCNAIDYVLRQANIRLEDVERVGVCTQQPMSHPLNDLAAGSQLSPLYETGRVVSISHHRGHAASAFFTSNYRSAAVLVIDGAGSPAEDLPPDEKALLKQEMTGGCESVSIYHAHRETLTPLIKVMAPTMYGPSLADGGLATFHTFGGLYSAVSTYVFKDGLDGPGKLMSLAAFGTPDTPIDRFYSISDDGLPDFRPDIAQIYAEPAPGPRDLVNLAASAQRALENAVLHFARMALRLTGERHLCMAGGVALNGIANHLVVNEVCHEFHVPPAAEDCGTAIGAAVLVSKARSLQSGGWNDAIGGTPDAEQSGGSIITGRFAQAARPDCVHR